MREAIHSLEKTIRDGGDPKLSMILVTEVLADLANRLEDQNREIGKMRQTLETLVKGGKPIGASGGNPFSIG